jgi:CRP/FNR family cyclic AMP-dependent transcriptional regulator
VLFLLPLDRSDSLLTQRESEHILQRGQITIETLAGGEVLGSWLFPPYRWQFSARVVEPTQVIVMDGVYLRDKAEQDNVFGYELVKRVAQVIAERLQATR